jgi:type IV fimbrial biogenesis protein FimT
MGTGSTSARATGATRTTRGFTLIELMTTVAITGIVVTMATPSLAGWVDDQRLRGAAGELAADLQQARLEAVLRQENVRVSVQVQNGCYVLHTGAAGACRCEPSGGSRCDGTAETLKTVAFDPARGLNLQASAPSVLFAGEHGTATPATTLRVSTRSGRSVHQVVNLMGRVRSCSPQGQVSGYRVC